MIKRFWSGIEVFCAGNFVSLTLTKVRGNYVIENKDEILNKLFIIKQYNPFTIPDIEERKEFSGKKLEFHVEEIEKKTFRIIGYREIKIIEQKGEEIKIA